MSEKTGVTRRDFMKILSLAGAGLVIEVMMTGCSKKGTPAVGPAQATPTATVEASQPTAQPAVEETITVNIFLRIGKDGLVYITVPRSELGQGSRTALAMIVADELCADWSTVRIEQAPAGRKYGDQNTGGSTSISTFYNPLRKAGALGRTLMVNAAAAIWEVAPGECKAENNSVVHSASGKKLAYSELVDKAGQMEPPAESDVALKDPKEFTIIGTNIGRYDNPQIVRGKTTFGMDVRLPDMLFASIALAPTLGAKLVNTDDSAALKVPGVKKIVPLGYGVAVLADNTWAAMRGRDALQLTWEGGRNFNSEAIEQDLLAKAGETPPEADELVGVYVFPYFGHVTMEPMNCTADVRADSCEVWVPTQNPQGVQSNASMWARVSSDKVRVNVTLVGGGFGRRLEASPAGSPPVETDYVAQAVNLSKLVGAPVQVVWTREDDVAHDLFHPISVYRASAKLNGIKKTRLRRFESYDQVPTGYWRSVTNPPEAFAHECFLDEYAAAANMDPLELRRQLLPAYAMAVIDLAAEKAGWGKPLPAGHGLGLAYHSTWGVTGVAMLAEVSVTNGALTVHRVVAAVDCGRAINPDMVVAQIESGIVFGLTTVLKKNIRIENGQVQHSNFSDYPILRFDEMPSIEVHILPSEGAPTGVGEMANPPLAPAVANAVYAATGKRIRRVPIQKEDLAG